MKLRTRFVDLLSCFCMTTLLCQPVFALTNTFGGMTTSSYSSVASRTQKTNNYDYTEVDWITSDRASHNQYFKMFNVTLGVDAAAGRFTYLGRGRITGPNMSSGYYYTLMSRREHIIDPRTYISGTFTP